MSSVTTEKQAICLLYAFDPRKSFPFHENKIFGDQSAQANSKLELVRVIVHSPDDVQQFLIIPLKIVVRFGWCGRGAARGWGRAAAGRGGRLPGPPCAPHQPVQGGEQQPWLQRRGAALRAPRRTRHFRAGDTAHRHRGQVSVVDNNGRNGVDSCQCSSLKSVGLARGNATSKPSCFLQDTYNTFESDVVNVKYHEMAECLKRMS